MRETIIVGGGLAGGAAATLLARAGRQVRLFEREPEPTDKVCGEFLSPEAQRGLMDVGIDLDHLGATHIDVLRLSSGQRMIETRLPFTARGLSRKRLDAALLAQAETAGARIERGVAVRSIRSGIVETRLGDVAPDVLLIASGKHELRGAARDVTGCDTGFAGFKTHWRLGPRATADLAGKVDVVFFEGGYAGVQMVEGGRANLCLVVDKARLAQLGGDWDGVLAALMREPRAAAILQDAGQLTRKPLAIAGVPYGFVYQPAVSDGEFRIGDQAAVIPSLCGEGMAIALHSARLAASAIAAGGSPEDHHKRMRHIFAPRLRVALALQRMGMRPWSRALAGTALRLWPRAIVEMIRLTRIADIEPDSAPPQHWPFPSFDVVA